MGHKRTEAWPFKSAGCPLDPVSQGAIMPKTPIPIRDVISSDVVHINPHDTLRDALALMVENRVSALPVVDAQLRCLGVISVTDLLSVTKDLADELNALAESGGMDHEVLVKRLEHAEILTEQVKDWMSAEVVSIDVHGTVQHAAREMLRNRIHRVIVLDDRKRVVGVVSTMDLLAALVEAPRP
jgi:CBS domain-containing protein